MKIEWNKVTKFSQIIAIILFVAVFFLGFFIGLKYGILLSENTQQQISENTNTIPIESTKTDFIRLDTPFPNQIIKSPLIIKGVARGSWFFEASFPVILTNWDGLIIAQGTAQAKSDWMTSDFVP